MKKFLEADAVILAVGQSSDLSFLPPDLEVKITEKNRPVEKPADASDVT